MKIDYPFIVWVLVVFAFAVNIEMKQNHPVGVFVKSPAMSLADSAPFERLAREGIIVQPLPKLDLFYFEDEFSSYRGFVHNCVASEVETKLLANLTTLNVQDSLSIQAMSSNYILRKIACSTLAKKICNLLNPEQKKFIKSYDFLINRRKGEKTSDYILRNKMLKILELKSVPTKEDITRQADKLDACWVASQEYKVFES